MSIFEVFQDHGKLKCWWLCVSSLSGTLKDIVCLSTATLFPAHRIEEVTLYSERTKSRTFVKQLLLFRKATLKLGANCRGVLTESLVFSLLNMPFVFWLPVPLARKRQLLAAGAVKQPADCQNPLAAALTLPLWLRHCCPHHPSL